MSADQTTARDSRVDASIHLERCRDGKWDFHVWLGDEYLGVGWRHSAWEALEAAKARLAHEPKVTP
jgi:hypothetical protein